MLIKLPILYFFLHIFFNGQDLEIIRIILDSIRVSNPSLTGYDNFIINILKTDLVADKVITTIFNLIIYIIVVVFINIISLLHLL